MVNTVNFSKTLLRELNRFSSRFNFVDVNISFNYNLFKESNFFLIYWYCLKNYFIKGDKNG